MELGEPDDYGTRRASQLLADPQAATELRPDECSAVEAWLGH